MKKKLSSTYTMIYVSMMVSLLIVLTQIQIPFIGGIPITLQTLGVFIIAQLLGPKLGVITILIYLFLGTIGVPVFASFQSGIHHILGPTGGFLIGFIPMVLISTLGSSKKFYISYLYQCLGLILCYLFGCLMYYRIYHILFLPTLPIMLLKDLFISFISILLSKEISIRIHLIE